MKVIKTVKLEMTEEEKKAIRTVYRMLYDLEWDEERALAEELEYEDLILTRQDLVRLYELGGGREEDLR